MNVDQLNPTPNRKENFQRDRQRFVPYGNGCYALTTFQGHILYVGLTKDLNRRMGEHLDDAKKTAPTSEGKATFFHWLECENIESVERGWLNWCEIVDGKKPVFNVVGSPVST